MRKMFNSWLQDNHGLNSLELDTQDFDYYYNKFIKELSLE